EMIIKKQSIPLVPFVIKHIQQEDIGDLMTSKDLEKLKREMRFYQQEDDDTTKITRLNLPYGIQVVLKSLNSRNIGEGRVLLKSIHLNEKKNDNSTLDKYSHLIVSQSGLGSFNNSKKKQFFSANGIKNVYPYDFGTDSGFGASFDSRAFEKVLQAIFLYYTDPRVDSSAVREVVASAKQELLSHNESSSRILSDTLEYYTTGKKNDLNISVKDLDTLSVRSVRNYFIEKFAVTSNTTFIIAGSFNLPEYIALINKYLGSLPKREILSSQTGAESIVKRSPKVQNIVVKSDKIKGDSGEVRLRLEGVLDFSPANKIMLDIINGYLEIQMFERLRVVEKGVYSVSTSASILPNSPSKFFVDIAFSCAASNVNRLINAAKEEIEKVREFELSSDFLMRCKLQLTSSYQQNLTSEFFWIESMENQLRSNRSYKEVLSEAKIIDQLSSSDLLEFAKANLDTRNMSQYVLSANK
ncbi:MAG TPA: insulinase family protein, partial [Pedobacter sp.]|nr:insulinase family protein [Pedobacter sp.]